MKAYIKPELDTQLAMIKTNILEASYPISDEQVDEGWIKETVFTDNIFAE